MNQQAIQQAGNGIWEMERLLQRTEPITSYVKPGVYTVKLTVKGSSGTDSVVKTDYITVYANPQANFNASPVEGCFPLDVNFTNSSQAGSGTITDYLWDFGDGVTSTTAQPDHIYTSSGTLDVTLKVTNNYGCTNALTTK